MVGAGLMGRWHAHYARRNGAQVAAIVDGSTQAASTVAGLSGNAAVFGDMGAMLEAAKPRAVHICTPLATHLALALQAVEAGAHALVEKPLTATAGETQALLQKAQERGVVVCPVHQFAFQRGMARATVALEVLGEALHARFAIHSAGGEGSSAEPDAIIADVLPHPFSVVQALWPRSPLLARDWSATRPRSGELHVRGASGSVPVDIHISMNARPTRCDLEILCSAGSIHLNFFHGYATVRQGKPSRADKIGQPFRIAGSTFTIAAVNLAGRAWRRELAYPGLGELVGAFYGAVRGTRGPPVPVDDALAVARVREHLLEQTRLTS